MARPPWPRRVVLAAIGVALAAAIYLGFATTPGALRTFDADRMAARETAMWKAYYDKRNAALFADLVVMLRERYGYPWATAARMAFYLARAAATFGNLRSDYEQVLPDLDAAYRLARDWSDTAYDPAAVARAELAWWVARRIPGQDSPEQVGGLIADLNALLYGVDRERVLQASVLRARAGRLRDLGGAAADWDEVRRLLEASYQSLRDAVTPPR